jgi:hypothetical protein
MTGAIVAAVISSAGAVLAAWVGRRRPPHRAGREHDDDQ